MNLDKETIRKIRGLIVFAVIAVMMVWKYEVFFKLLHYGLNIILPFLIGVGIAFVLNVPMHFIEEKVFGQKKLKENKTAQKLARPVSFVLTLIFVVRNHFPRDVYRDSGTYKYDRQRRRNDSAGDSEASSICGGIVPKQSGCGGMDRRN